MLDFKKKHSTMVHKCFFLVFRGAKNSKIENPFFRAVRIECLKPGHKILNRQIFDEIASEMSIFDFRVLVACRSLGGIPSWTSILSPRDRDKHRYLCQN
jgi:hypothetical protein